MTTRQFCFRIWYISKELPRRFFFLPSFLPSLVNRSIAVNWTLVHFTDPLHLGLWVNRLLYLGQAILTGSPHGRQYYWPADGRYLMAHTDTHTSSRTTSIWHRGGWATDADSQPIKTEHACKRETVYMWSWSWLNGYQSMLFSMDQLNMPKYKST